MQINKVSIIIPVFNVGVMIDEKIKKLLSQPYKNIELILINDGSTDNTLEILLLNKDKDNRIKVLDQINQGPGIARKKGLDVSEGDYVVFIDADDEFKETIIIENIRVMENYKPDVIVNNFEYCISNTDKIYKSNLPLKGFYDREGFIKSFNEYEKMEIGPLWNKMYDKNFLLDNDINFNRFQVAEDVIFNYDVYSKLNSIYFTDKSYYRYNVSSESSISKKFHKNRYQMESKMYNKYKEMLESFNSGEDIKIKLTLKRWEIVYREIININKDDSPYSIKEKYNKVKSLQKECETNNVFNIINLKKHKLPLIQSVIFTLLNFKMYFSIILLLWIYNFKR